MASSAELGDGQGENDQLGLGAPQRERDMLRVYVSFTYTCSLHVCERASGTQRSHTRD